MQRLILFLVFIFSHLAHTGQHENQNTHIKYVSEGERSPKSEQQNKSAYLGTKVRRNLTIYNAYQLHWLEDFFKKEQHPNIFQKQALANEISIDNSKIQMWFQDRRANAKKIEDSKGVPLHIERPLYDNQLIRLLNTQPVTH